MRLLYLFIVLCCLMCPPKPAWANEALIQQLQKNVAELTALVKDQGQIIQTLGARVNTLEGVGNQTQITPTLPSGAPKLKGISQGFNPDIGLAGTVVGSITKNAEDAEGNNSIALKELELNVSQVVDPFSRLDAIITFNDGIEDQNVEIEEAYYSHWGLPFGFQGRIGKFRPKIGKQNLLHLHQLDTVDYPLVIADVFGEEGLAASGARLSNHIPNPFDIPIEITGEFLRGNEGNSFSGLGKRPIFNTHVKTFFETSDNSSLELGGTLLVGNENNSDDFGLFIFGADATFLWDLPEGRKIKLQGELYAQDREGQDEKHGFYTLLDFRFHPKFSGGIRYDYVNASGANAELAGLIQQFSPYLTFWQSEFANFRIQYNHTRSPDGESTYNDAVLLQANFAIGAHRHPVQ